MIIASTTTLVLEPESPAVDDVVGSLDGDLREARDALMEARRSRAEKDTPAAREALAQAMERMNTLLDLRLDLLGVTP